MTERAPAFPFEPNAGGVWPMVEDDDLCQDDIEAAIQIEVGELPIEKTVGSRMARSLFSNYDSTMAAAATKFADDAVRQMVGRVVVLNAKITTDDGTYSVALQYQRISGDTPGTMAFPMGVTK